MTYGQALACGADLKQMRLIHYWNMFPKRWEHIKMFTEGNLSTAYWDGPT